MHQNIDKRFILFNVERLSQLIFFDKIPGAVTIISTDELRLQTSISDDLMAILANLVPSMTPSR